MGCGAAEATGLGFVCFVVINPRVLLANRVDLTFFVSYISNFTPPPQRADHVIRIFLFSRLAGFFLTAFGLLLEEYFFSGLVGGYPFTFLRKENISFY